MRRATCISSFNDEDYTMSDSEKDTEKALDTPKIEFPCDYPIKVLGRAAPDFRELVVEVVRRHAPDLDELSVSVQASGKGRFMSVRMTIRATGKPQLQALHGDLLETGRVQMVL